MICRRIVNNCRGICTFALANSQTHAEPASSECRSGYEEGALHFEMRR